LIKSRNLIHEEAKTLRKGLRPWAGQPAGSATADAQGERSAKLAASCRAQQATAQQTPMTDKPKTGGAPEVDLDEVRKLVEALEQDLEKVKGGSRDVQVLRDEVETLKNVLDSPVRRHHWVRDGLHGIRDGFENAVDTAIAEGMSASRYVAEIGRILGM